MASLRRRIFVMGAPRSGTTLMQGILNAHPEIVSFPESHFFSFMTNDLYWRMYGTLAPLNGMSPLHARIHRLRCQISVLRGRSNPFLKKRIDMFLERAELEEHAQRFATLPNRITPLVKEFVQMLDEIAGNKHWVEKTPTHVFFTNLIEKNVPEARFVHVIRNGEDTLGSIMDAALKYPSWHNRFIDGENTIPRMLALWNRSVRAALKNTKRPNHLILSYEAVVADPDYHTRQLASFLDLPHDAAMSRINTTSTLAKNEEPWKMKMGGTIRLSESKFGKVFSIDEQEQIKKGLIGIPPHTFQSNF